MDEIQSPHMRPATRPSWWTVAVVALAAALPYLRTLAYPFVYDDGSIIVSNAALHAPSGVIAAWTLPYWPPAVSGPAGLYRPLVQCIYAVLWNLGGGRAAPFHVWAVLLHVAAATAVLVLLAHALDRRFALLGALLFAVHPVHVEAVASIVGSAEALAALLAMAFAVMLWRADERAADGAPYGWRTAAALGVVYALALGAKESAATIPALGLATVWGWRAPDRRPSPDGFALVRRGWRVWVACAIALGAMTLARHAVLGTLAPPATMIADGIAGVNATTRFWTMTSSWPTVGALLFWPAHLMMHYGPSAIPTHPAPTPRAVVSVVVLAACIAACLACSARRPAAALVWMLVGFLPASNILVPTGQLLAERTLYVPSIGAVMLAAWLLDAGSLRLTQGGVRRAPALAMGIVAALLVIGVVRATAYAGVWRSDPALFASGIAADPAAVHPRIQLARWYGRHGQEDRALAQMDTAFHLAPDKEDLAFEYASHLLTDHRAAAALPVLEQAAALSDTSPRLRLTYLTTLMTVRGPRAVVNDVAAHPAPDAGGPLRFVILGNAYRALGLADSALGAYAAGVRASPEDAQLRVVWARALTARGLVGEARAQMDTAALLGEPRTAER